MSGATNTQLAAAIQAVIANVDAREDQLLAWQSGSPTGGPFGDGRYEIVNLLGESSYFKSPARLEFEVGLLTDAGSGAVAASEAARDAAQAAQVSAATDAQNSAGSAATSTSQASQAEFFRDQAANSEANALVHRNAAEAAAAVIVPAASELEALRDEALAARDVTVVARNEAQTARDDAQGFAASINPANLATTAELQLGLDGKLNLSGGTLTGNLSVQGAMNVGTNDGTQTLALGLTSESGEKRFRLRNNQWTTGTDLVVSSSSKSYGFYNRDRTNWDLLINGSTGAISNITSASIINGLTVGGELETNGRFLIQSAGPTQWWQDTDHRSFGIHTNNNIAYFMRSSVNGTSWTGQEINGRWPLQMNLNDGNIFAASTIEAQALVTRDKITRSGQGAYLHYNTASRQSGRITVSTATPSGGSNGDVWFQV